MAFQSQVTLRLGQLEDRVKDAEELQVRGLVVGWPLEQGTEGLQDALLDRAAIADDEGSDAGAADNQELKGLPQHVDVAAQYHVVTDNAADDDQ